MDLNGECKGGDGFIDRSRVRILLCDNDSKSLGDVFTLLSECSYQVTLVKSARQVIDALNAEGPDIDIILAEIDLPMAKGMKMLRYITRHKDLRRIPVIMMSSQDEVAVVVKCLKLGAADYLVKPLRTNELLNLWTHMWRRRRMLGLAEKNMLNYDFDLVGSDPSDRNTNSTNLFSDDTDDRSLRSTNLQIGTFSHHENECSVAYAGDGDGGLGSDGIATSTPDVIEPPKKNRLKIGESSAFFTYVKSTVPGATCQDPPHATENGSLHLHPDMVEKLQVVASEGINNTKQGHRSRETEKKYSQGENLQNGAVYPSPLGRSQTLPTSMELHKNDQERTMNTARIATKDTPQSDGSGFSTQNPYPYYIHGVMNQVMMQSAAMMPQYGHHQLPPYPPYYNHSMNTSLQHNQMSQNGQWSLPNGQISMFHHSWSPIGNQSSNRREEALLKFRRKRNQRCFDKKIRYVNRKRLAERRPRVKGQFVRKMNGVNVDLNGHPDEEEEEEEEEEENGDSSPQDDSLGT